MNEDLNPSKAPDDSGGNAQASLAGALEKLIQSRSSRGSAPQSDLPALETNEIAGSPHNSVAAPCPQLDELALLLGEGPQPLDQARLDALLSHAALCGSCAEKLCQLSAEVSEDESAILARLHCQSPEGQQSLAVRLAQTPRVAPRRHVSRLYHWTGVGLAASLLIAILLTSWWRAARNPDRLLAQAYTGARLFDLRMPGADFAEVTPAMHLRGSAGAQPPKLLEARARIEAHLEAAPDDPRWLELEARSDILEEKFDTAIDILNRLVTAGPVTANLLLDDAAACFQRGAVTGNESDRAAALDLLRRADELAPDNPVVLFNEALVMEDRGQLVNAVETWNRYLRFERDPAWLAEGRRRLEALELKLNQLKPHQGQ